MDDLRFRSWRSDDQPFLWEMLYQSLHVREGAAPFPRSVLDNPDIAHYLRQFGERAGDDAQLCVRTDGRPIGAAWCRRLSSEDRGYGYIDDEIPELGMAVEASWRGRGIGRRLLQDLLGRHPVMSLSVDDENVAAATLYRSLGFVAIEMVEGSTTMLCRRAQPSPN